MLLRETAKVTAQLDITEERIRQELAGVAFSSPEDSPNVTEKLRALEILAKIQQLFKDATPPAQWNLDLATLGKLSDEELETALKHAEAVQAILTGTKAAP